jgi:hypothetical protein
VVAAVVVGLYSAVDLYFGPFYPPAGPVAAVYSGPGFADSAVPGIAGGGGLQAHVVVLVRWKR